MNHDVLIIGSGFGGLLCGSILTRSGLSVCVLERGHHAGGSLQSYRRGDFLFDTGLHYVGGLSEGQSLYNIFHYAGLMNLPWHRMDTYFDHIVIGNRDFRFAQGYQAFAETLSADFPSERQNIKDFVIRLQNITIEDCSISAWEYLHKQFSDPLLINVLCATSMKTELRAQNLSLFSLGHTLCSYIESSWRLQGDGGTLVQRLVDSITSGGGRVCSDHEVTDLQFSDGNVVGVVCANGSSFNAPYVIADIHPSLLADMVARQTSSHHTWVKRMQQTENTDGIFTCSLVLKPHTIHYLNHNTYIYQTQDVWRSPQPGAPVHSVMMSCRVPIDESTYARQIDLLTPMSWSECEQWAGTRIGHRGADYEHMCQEKSEQCIALAETYVPDLHDVIECSYTSTPLTYHDYLAAPRGTAFGMRKDYHNPLLTHLSVCTPFPHLLLTGQNVMLPGLEGVAMTAMETCRHIVGAETINSILTRD